MLSFYKHIKISYTLQLNTTTLSSYIVEKGQIISCIGFYHIVRSWSFLETPLYVQTVGLQYVHVPGNSDTVYCS